MCDAACAERKPKDAGCPVSQTDSVPLQDLVKAKNLPSTHSDRKERDSGTMSIPIDACWMRETVDPSYTLKPLEYQAKEPSDGKKEGLLFQALSYEAFQPPGAERKRKTADDAQRSQESHGAPPPTAPFFCDLCNRKFTRQSNLTEHMLRHTGKVYDCDVCLKKFSCLRYLTRHLRVHSGEQTPKKVSPKAKSNEHKSYVCVFCNKHFSCKSHLVAHTRIHTGEKPYSCEICQKTFNHKSHLTAHTRIHTGERPFQCRICQKQFRDPSNLAGHMRVHNGQKPFACQYCDEQFSHRSQLKKHERSHVDEPNSICCLECGKVVSDAAKLKCHMKVHASRSNGSSKYLACGFCSGQFEVKRGQDKTLACDLCAKQLAERMRREDRAYMLYAVGNQ